MYPTSVRLRMASTRGGMRRILKNKGSVLNYIRQAVETGVYRSNDELERVRKERRDSADDLRTIMRRFRQDIVRGSNIHDYPVEYTILKQHPPIPDPPHIPVKLLKRMKQQENPTEKLVQKYLKRQEQQQRNNNNFEASSATSSSISTEEYYRRLFGISAPPLHSAMGQKTANVQRAYAAAVKQYQLQRTEGLSEADALAQVEALLAEQDSAERVVSRERAIQVQELTTTRTQQQQKPNQQRVEAASSSSRSQDDTTSTNADATSSYKDKASWASSLRSVFGDNPRGIEGMMIWSERLNAVPYVEWTVGASTALDHWIARQVLGLSEETWQLLLVGDDISVLSRGRDIIAVRESLFPETRDSQEEQEDDDETGEEEEKESVDARGATKGSSPSEKSGANKTIEELLAAIGGLTTPEGAKKKADGLTWIEEEDVNDLDAKVERLVNELQDWRRKNMDTPYSDWDKVDKEEFGSWMKEYVRAVSSDASRGHVDYDSTREALLSQPPVSREEAESFWNKLQDEAHAAELLGEMLKSGPPPGASFLHAAFWSLPYEKQLDRLLNLGALRPLLDEYSKESDRVKFLQRYGDTLLTGIEMEHLVPDLEGPVRASDIGPAADDLGVSTGDRFRLVLLPYRSSQNMSAQEKTRALYAAWNEHKAGRARYEEKLFKTGRLGLRYQDEEQSETSGDDE